MAVATVDEYLSALEKSKLLASEQLAQAQSLAGKSADAAALARALARDKLVSRWQAGTLLALGRRAQLRLGKYKLIERLGKGGMGTVFLAEHVTMNRRVALKIVPRSIANDRASLDRFFAEARAIAALDHPNIVQAYSVDNEMDRYFIVMEFIDGQDLQRMVEVGGPLPPARAAHYVCQAAEGLAHAHARNLVHCDIKPSNLLVTNQGVIKILDLGLARLDQSDEPRESGEPAIGTVDYMAPEQGIGAEDFDHRADIYSLGCTLYFLLTGHPPFPEGTIAQRIVKHQMQQPRDILAEQPGTPPKLAEICQRMMAKKPEERFQTMLEVSAALVPLLDGNIGPTAPVPRAVKPIEEAANGEADDWLAALSDSNSSFAISKEAILRPGKSGAMRSSVRSGEKTGSGRMRRATASRGLADACRAKLAWFNTTSRKILGVVGAACALTAVAALAALPVLLSPTPKTPPPPQVKAADKPRPLEEEVARPIDSVPDKSPIQPQAVATGTLPTAKDRQPVKTTHPATKPETAKAETLPRPDIKTGPTLPAQSPIKPEVAREPPSAKPGASSKPVEVVKQVSLAELLAAKDLPAIKDPAAISLGKLESGPRTDLDIQLFGGETIARGNPKFELTKDNGGDAPAWNVLMADKNKDGIKIARISLDGGDCKFQWMADARERASLLRFCGLEFRSGKEKHFTALTAPKTVPPLVIDVDGPPTRHRLTRGLALPDASLLRLRIMALDKTMPKYEIKVMDKGHPVRTGRGKPQESVIGDTVAAKGQAIVTLTKDRTPHLKFTIRFDARGKDVSLDMQGVCEIGNRTVPFNAKALRDFANTIDMMANTINKNPRKAASAEQIQSLKMTQTELKALDDLIGELNKSAAIPFRIYIAGQDDAAHQVVIFESGQIETPKAPAQKKNRGKRQQDRIVPDADALNGK
jgi:serine/threonine protein kinase